MSKKKTEKGADHFVHVFVYGSLKQTLGNHGYLTSLDAEFVGYDTISGPFSMVSLGGFPAVCHDSSVNCATVFGQIYRVRPDGLDALDALEGHPRWYRREKLRTDLHDVRAWIYLFPETELPKYEDRLVPDNMWRIAKDERAFWEENHDLEFAA